MTLLAIETATDMVGVALVRDDGGVAERIHIGGRAHAELLIPSVEEVCVASGCTTADIDHIAVDIGPGLFTGLRVGVATAKALGQALSVGLIGVTSLDILAAAALERDTARGLHRPGTAPTVAAVVDARRGEVFAAAYPFGRSVAGSVPGEGPIDPAWVRDDRPEPLGPDELEAWLVDLVGRHGTLTVVGDGAVRYHRQLSARPGLDLGTAAELAAPPPVALAHLALARLAQGQEPVPAGSLVPEYRRPADAKINWEQRAPRTAPPTGEGAR